MTEKFEYSELRAANVSGVFYEAATGKPLLQSLNNAGNMGWEVVGIVPHTALNGLNAILIFLKRKKV